MPIFPFAIIYILVDTCLIFVLSYNWNIIIDIEKTQPNLMSELALSSFSEV